mmetsp:Transcript_25412/g.36171  ORF Transcript_25412/g.36171 Transcript_25412/m.36171 type:complete len:151 (-) Transcript_25412:153-605(-)
MTLNAKHLFNAWENQKHFLSKDDADQFHHLTAKLLFLSQHGRPDIRTAVSFLLNLDARGPVNTQWWVDALYATHPDMKSHTGGVMSLGRGATYSTADKQKIVTRSSTEGELVGLHDVMPQVVWTNNFIECQGYGTQLATVYIRIIKVQYC